MTDTKQRADHTKTDETFQKKTSKTSRKLNTGVSPNGETPNPILESLRLEADATKHWLEASQDMARFYNYRLNKDFGYMTQFQSCRSPAQATALWCRIASETAHDYADQLDRVMEINLNGVSQAATGA